MSVMNYAELGDQPMIGGTVAQAIEEHLRLATENIADDESDDPRKVVLELGLKPYRNGKNERAGARLTPIIKVSFPKPYEPVVGDPIDCALAEGGIVARLVQEQLPI